MKNTPARGPRAAATLLLALVALVLVLLPGLASADDPGAGSGNGAGTVKNPDGTLKFGMGPGNNVPAKQVVDGRAYLVYAVNPGATILDKVAILNYDTKPLTLQVYATDAILSDTGVFGLLPGAEAPSGAGAWITMQHVPKNKKITIPGRTGGKPYGVRYVSFIAHVPRKATPGDHVGGIVGSLQTVSKNTKGAKVTLDQRIGVRAYFEVTGELKPALKIEDLKGSYASNWDPLGRSKYTVTYYVHNTGNLQLNVSQDLSINRCILKVICPSKLVAHPGDLKGLLPGARIKVTQTFDHKFGLGHPSVSVTLHSQAIDVTYKQKVPDVTTSSGFWAWPWLLLLEIVLALVIIGLGSWRYEKHRRLVARERAIAAAAPRPKHAGPPTP